MPGRRSGADDADSQNMGGLDTSSLSTLVARTTGRAGVSVKAGLDVILGKAGRYFDQETSRADLKRLIVPIQITAPQLNVASGNLVAGAGTLNYPDLLGPHDGFAWDVRRLAAASFTAGTVTAYMDNVADENIICTWTQAGLFTFGTSVILGDSDQLVFVAAGITGAVTISGQAIQIPTPLLPDYLL